jgi:hypothetical protein
LSFVTTLFPFTVFFFAEIATIITPGVFLFRVAAVMWFAAGKKKDLQALTGFKVWQHLTVIS